MKTYITTTLLAGIIAANAQTPTQSSISREDSICYTTIQQRTTYINAVTGQKFDLSDMQFSHPGDAISVTVNKDTARILFKPGAFERIDSTAHAFKLTIFGQPK